LLTGEAAFHFQRFRVLKDFSSVTVLAIKSLYLKLR